MGKVAKPETLSRTESPDAQKRGKNLGIHFEKELKGYLLGPSLNTTSFLTPI